MLRNLAGILLTVTVLAGQQYRAFWADAFHAGFKTPAQVEQMLDDLTAARANAVFAEVRRRGDAYYLHALEPPADDPDYPQSFDALDYLVERAHARGIEVHAWFPVLPAGTSNNPAHVGQLHGAKAQGDGMWMTVSSKGRISTSLDPGHPAAAKYLADVILEPARWYAIDGLHLDYIRYPEDADYGWNPVAVARYQRLRNKVGTPAAEDADWAAFRREQVTALVRQIYLRAFAIRPSIRISGAFITWGNGPTSDEGYRKLDAYSRVFQDWRGWMEEGIVDLGMPMNYFRERQYPTYFNRWIEYEKDRQYGREMLIGPAIYLNPIESSLEQLKRAMAPSAAGNSALGVCFYSYASTNTLDAAGTPVEPNSSFYRAVGDWFGAASTAPELAWKAAPTRGHLYGTLHVEGGESWLNDGASIFIETEAGDPVRTVATDGTGFFGAVDLASGSYRVRLERGGVELWRSVAQDVAAGAAVNFEINLKGEDFEAARPQVTAADVETTTPGSVVTLQGRLLAGGTQVLVNGMAAGLMSEAPEQLQVQMPWSQADPWTVVVRRAGMESAPFRLRYATVAPAIAGVVRREQYLEIYARGLGPVSPAPAPGVPASDTEPLNRTVLPVTVKIGEAESEVLYAGLAPGKVGLYQVNARLPEGVTAGVVQLVVGGQTSAGAAFE